MSRESREKRQRGKELRERVMEGAAQQRDGKVQRQDAQLAGTFTFTGSTDRHRGTVTQNDMTIPSYA